MYYTLVLLCVCVSICVWRVGFQFRTWMYIYIYAAAKSLQSCPTLCDPRDGSPPGSPVPGILQARALEWLAISFSNAWKWKVKVKSLRLSAWKLHSRVRLLVTPWTAAHQPPPSWDFPGKVLEWGAIAFSDSSSSSSSSSHIYMRSYLISICGYTVILCSNFKIYKALSFMLIYSLYLFKVVLEIYPCW